MVTSAAFDLLAVVACSTKRAAWAAGKRSTPAANLTGLKCTPLDPVDADTAERAGLDSPIQVFQVFLDGGLDIVEGDWLTIDGTDYPIRAVWDWTYWGLDDTQFKHLILEGLKS